MNIVVISQARTGSTRLPNKVMKEIDGNSLLSIHLSRLIQSKMATSVVVATTTNDQDNVIIEEAKKCKVDTHRGSENDVLDRYYHAAKSNEADIIVRVTSDCPLLDPVLIDAVIEKLIETGSDYATNTFSGRFPDGQDVEVFTMKSLEKAWENATLTSDREHVTPYIIRNKSSEDSSGESKFKVAGVDTDQDYNHVRLTVDTQSDFEVIEALVNKLGIERGWKEYTHFYINHEEISSMNSDTIRNEGFMKSLNQDLENRYTKSEELLEQAQQLIPLGSQTFSKSITQFPKGASPYFAKKAKGSRVWDVDGNEYIDFTNALAAITIGHADDRISEAVKEQMELGTIFSLNTEIEAQVAKKICEMVPSAEKVRFGKNGSDATAGAIRVARAFTGKDHVLVCGYHGWQDWYIGSTSRNAGVPKATRELTHVFKYNDIESLKSLFEELKGKVAAVVMEPINVEEPKNDFLNEVKRIAHANDTLLIFDEVVTGFRISNGGAQAYFDVTPDLTTLGKGLSNGYPLSAIAGRADVMKMFEEVFFSFTYGGETLSLAAANVTLDILKNEPVIEHLKAIGTKLIEELNQLIDEFKYEEFFSTAGLPQWSFLLIKDSEFATAFELKTLMLQEMFREGIITIGSHNLSYAHSEEDIDRLIAAYRKYFEKVQLAKQTKSIAKMLSCEVLQPLFKVR